MDRGGVWNGASEVTATTGDTFQFTICNSLAADATAYGLAGAVTLPAGFSYVAGTARGIPGMTASQGGAVLTLAIPAQTDIATGTCVTGGFGLTTDASVLAGPIPCSTT